MVQRQRLEADGENQMVVETEVTKDYKVGEEIEAACATCGDGKTHVIRASIKEYNADEPFPGATFEWIDTFQIIQCGGCKSYSFRKTQSNSEDFDPETGDHPDVVQLYPSRVKGRAPVNDHKLLPAKLQRIYLETLKALNSDQPVLAGIGIRAIVETVCKDQSAVGRDLQKKIDDLVIKYILSRAGADILQKLRVLGNKAAHEVDPHNVLQLGFGLDVIDNLVSSIYILPHHAVANFE